MNICGAKTRSGTPCKRPAGAGTNHVGEGKCKLHGGATPVKHGLYSKYTKHRLGDLIEELAHDPELLNIRQQIALKQALILDRLEKMQDAITPDDMAILSSLSEKVSRDIERLNKIEHGEKYILQVEEVQQIINQVVFIIRQEVADQALVERIGKRLQDVRW